MTLLHSLAKMRPMHTGVSLPNVRENPQTKAALISGALSGITGLLVFLVVHAVWIMPIWFILPVGMPIAVAGGLAVGWAYVEIKHRLPPRPWTVLSIIGSIAIVLLPGTLLAELRRPMFVFTPTGPMFQMDMATAVAIFVVELLFTATLMGGLLGWLIGRTMRAALWMALAGFIFALGPGHNIPFIGGTGGVFMEWAIMGAIIISSAVVLVEGQAWLSKRRADFDPSDLNINKKEKQQDEHH
jgi:hypothetical protein